MRWLSQRQPITLYQTSLTPYVILKDGVFLCYENCYAAAKPNPEKYHIALKTHRNLLERQSATFFKFKSFPVMIPFVDVERLNNAVINGRIIRTAAETIKDDMSMGIIDSRYVDDLTEDKLNAVTRAVRQHNKTVLVASDHLGTASHLLMDDVVPVCGGDWGRVAVSILHHACPKDGRKYCWTQSCPDITLTCYGIKPDDAETLYNFFTKIDAPIDLKWSNLF